MGNAMVVGLILARGNELLFINIFIFFALVPTQNPGIEVLHSIRNALQNSAESGGRSGLTLNSLFYSSVCGIRREADLF